MPATEQLAQNRLVVFGRGVERHNRQRHHLLGHRHSSLGAQRCIGQDRGGGGGSVDQRAALPGLQLEALRQLSEQRVQHQNFARSALTLGRYAGDGAVVQHTDDLFDQAGRRHPMATQQIGEPREGPWRA